MTIEARWRCGIMGMAEKVRGEYSCGRARWQRFETTGIDTAAEKMRDGNKRDVGQQIWRNGLEGRRQTGQISTGNDYQP